MVQFTSGQKTDSRTLAMLKEAEKQSGCPIVVVQGSWSNGKYSAGTHSGAGVVDIRVWNQSSPAAIDSLVLWLRRVGFAAWYRTIGSGPHIHAVAIGADGLHWSAANQVKSYYNGRDGLAANGKDPGPRLNPIPTWESYNKDQTLPDTGKPEDNGVSAKDVIDALKSPEGQGLLANGVAAALRDGPVVRREFKELFAESLREQEVQKLIGNAMAAALRDGWVVRREMVELSEAGATKANQKEKN